MTTLSTELEPTEIIQAPDTLDSRRDRCSLDDAYIFNFTNNPKAGKTEALRNAGYEGNYIRQEAHRIHNRLRPRINAVLKEYMQDLGSLSHIQLNSILQMDIEDTGLQGMLAAIKLGFDYSGNKPVEAENITPKPALSEVQKRIEALQKQISLVKPQRNKE